MAALQACNRVAANCPPVFPPCNQRSQTHAIQPRHQRSQLPRIAAELEEYQAGREAAPEPTLDGKTEVGEIEAFAGGGGRRSGARG